MFIQHCEERERGGGGGGGEGERGKEGGGGETEIEGLNHKHNGGQMVTCAPATQ